MSDDSVNKAFRPEENAPEPGPGRETSPEERDGVPDTDVGARTPLGVGESVDQRAEDVARAEDREGTKGAAARPYGGGVADEPEQLG